MNKIPSKGDWGYQLRLLFFQIKKRAAEASYIGKMLNISYMYVEMKTESVSLCSFLDCVRCAVGNNNIHGVLVYYAYILTDICSYTY
jgi:hypothetical protein